LTCRRAICILQIIFSIGNIKPLLAIQWPNCFGMLEPMDCSSSLLGNLEDIQIVGIITGALA
jgi:hypothetical protein